MKKLNIFSCLLALFIFTGCSSSNSKNNIDMPDTTLYPSEYVNSYSDEYRLALTTYQINIPKGAIIDTSNNIDILEFKTKGSRLIRAFIYSEQLSDNDSINFSLNNIESRSKTDIDNNFNLKYSNDKELRYSGTQNHLTVGNYETLSDYGFIETNDMEICSYSRFSLYLNKDTNQISKILLTSEELEGEDLFNIGQEMIRTIKPAV